MGHLLPPSPHFCRRFCPTLLPTLWATFWGTHKIWGKHLGQTPPKNGATIWGRHPLNLGQPFGADTSTIWGNIWGRHLKKLGQPAGQPSQARQPASQPVQPASPARRSASQPGLPASQPGWQTIWMYRGSSTRVCTTWACHAPEQ